MKEACLAAAKFFNEVAQIFDKGASKLSHHFLEDSVTQDKKEKKKESSKAQKEEKKEAESEGKKTPKATEKKKKKEKDPNAPKKPLTAFMLYTNSRRPVIKGEN